MNQRKFTEQTRRRAKEIVRYCHTNGLIEYLDEFVFLMTLDASPLLCPSGNRASIRADSNRELFDILDSDSKKKERILGLFGPSEFGRVAERLATYPELRETVLTLYETQVQPYLEGAN